MHSITVLMTVYLSVTLKFCGPLGGVYFESNYTDI